MVVVVVMQQAKHLGTTAMKTTIEQNAVGCSVNSNYSVAKQMELKDGHVSKVVWATLCCTSSFAKVDSPIFLYFAMELLDRVASAVLDCVAFADMIVCGVLVDLGLANNQGASHADVVTVLDLNHTSLSLDLLLDASKLNVCGPTSARVPWLHDDVYFEFIVEVEVFVALKNFGDYRDDSFGCSFAVSGER